MHPKNEHLPLFNAFSDICQKAYGSWHLVTSPVLAKVGAADLFQEYAKGNAPPKPSKLSLLYKLFRYYAGGCVHFFLLLCCKGAYSLSGQRTVISAKQTVLVDSYFIISNFLKGEDPLKQYFPGITRPIADAGWEIVILPRFYGTRSPFRIFRLLRAIRAYKTPVFTEFQILMWRDYVYLCVHMLIYPWLVIGLLKYIPRTREGSFVRFALLNGLDSGNLLGAVRYFMGRRLTPLLPEKSRCLQWFENQTFERCLNRGLREGGATMPVYGAQLFLWPPEIINIHVDKNETAAQKPDVILVNGPYYKHENIDVPCKTGPSLRYARLFDTSIAPTGNKKTLVVLSQFGPEARFAIELAIRGEPPEKLMFKPHPTLQLPGEHKMLLPAESVIIEDDLYDAFHETDLVIGSSSGSLVEAAAIGIPVIVSTEKSAATYTYMPDIGRGLLWEFASNVEQFQEAKATLFDAIKHKNGQRMEAIESLRTLLFHRPTADGITDCLDLR